MSRKTRKKSFLRTWPGVLTVAIVMVILGGGTVVLVFLSTGWSTDQAHQPPASADPDPGPAADPRPALSPSPAPDPGRTPPSGPSPNPSATPRPLPKAKIEQVGFYYNADLCGPSRLLERCDALEDLKKRITALKYSLMKSSIDLRIETHPRTSKELLLNTYQELCGKGQIRNPNQLFMGEYFLIIERNKTALTGTSLLPEHLDQAVKNALK
jgi:hypothetical protein